MADEYLSQTTNEAVRHGKIIVIVSLASILMWILLSDGYHIKLGLIVSLLYTMKVGFFNIFDFQTSNLILFSLLMGTYGVLIWQRLTPSPVFLLRALIAKRKERNQAIASAQISIPTNRAEEKQVLPDNSKSKEDFFIKVFMAIAGAMFFLIVWIFLGSISSTP